MILIYDNDRGAVRLNPRYVISVRIDHPPGGFFDVVVKTIESIFIETFKSTSKNDAEVRLMEIIQEVDRSNKPEDRI